ncbi:MAG: exodeoxyribonuclease VII large subunit [Muribaculaceae bacterium]|nr:exodeoxyribonuclease VII large subunit [Muribaculaceae bacterium]
MKALSLLEMLNMVRSLVQQPQTQNVWVVAEVQDVACRGGHCYMEMLQKDDGGRQLARVRACIWANVYPTLARGFYAATGQQFTSGLKVMARVSASMHPVFGLSLVVSALNHEYTMGDLLRRRAEIIRRLTDEGVIDMNRRLQWPLVPQRIAVISAPGAAGYGDFMNQLYTNPNRIRFTTKLFQATMQGASAPASIIAALEAVADEADRWDGVVIIRGGGATSDLQAFEDYALAANVAQFPLPVAIGIGHERDITVLDWVANTRLKTPTAVAEWLVALGDAMLDRLNQAGAKILQSATDRVAGNREQLAQAEGMLPMAARGAVERGTARLVSAASLLSGVSARLLHPQLERLAMTGRALATAAETLIARRRQGLDASEKLLEALSPMATLKRGYSITRIDGHAITSAAGIAPGTVIETTLADGTIISTATNQPQK